MNKALIISALFLMVGCAPQQNINRQQQQDEINKTIPVCSSQKQCDAAWSATRQWVNQYCGMKIQNYSSDYIETYNSVGGNTSLACQVTKNPQPSGVTAITVNMSCGNMFGCIPDQYQAVINFNKYVTSAIEKVSPIRIGVMTEMSDKSGKTVDNPSYSVGLIIRSISPGLPASKSNLIVGDIISSIGNSRIRTQDEITTAMEKYHAGDSVKISIIRASSEQVINLSL